MGFSPPTVDFRGVTNHSFSTARVGRGINGLGEGPESGKPARTTIYMAKKKKVPSVLLTCVQKKNMWAKIFEKIWGIGTFGYVRSKTPIAATWLDPYGLWTAIAKKKSCDFWPFWPKMTCFCICRFCPKNAKNQ